MATLRERVVVHAYECVYEMARIGEREREREKETEETDQEPDRQRHRSFP